MDSMKSLLKSRSSHELLNQKSSPISSFGDSATTIHPSANTTLCTATSQLLQVPNVHSNSSSLINSSVSESSELSQVSDCDANDPHSKDSARKLKKLQKSIRKQRKRNEKQLAELVQFLHVEPPSPASASSSKLDELDQKCPSSRLNKSLQEYLHPDKENTSGSNKRKITVCKSLDVHNRTNITSNQKPPSIVPTIVAPRFQIGDDADPDDVDEDYAEANERTLTNNDTITAAGFRRIRRFGYDVADGCGFPLSMKREEQADADEHTLTLTRQKSWKDIIARADQYLHKQSITPQKIAVQQLYQVCPCPEIQCNSLSGVLPFRRWNSECRLSIRSTLERSESFASASSGSKDVLTSACNWTAFQQTTRRHSCEDLRHLSGCSLRNTQNYLQNHMPSISRQQSFGPMSDVSVCCSSELSSERSTSCSLRSMSSSCSSISGVSTLIALDLNQLGKFFTLIIKFHFKLIIFFATVDLNPFEVFNQHFDPRLVAVEMTKIEQDLFLQLNPTELSRQLFTSSRSINLSQFFEMHCIYFFVQLILNESQLSSRVQCLLLCIEVGFFDIL